MKVCCCGSKAQLSNCPSTGETAASRAWGREALWRRSADAEPVVRDQLGAQVRVKFLKWNSKKKPQVASSQCASTRTFLPHPSPVKKRRIAYRTRGRPKSQHCKTTLVYESHISDQESHITSTQTLWPHIVSNRRQDETRTSQRVHFHCADVGSTQWIGMLCTLEPHGLAGRNSVKRRFANPLQCWYLHCADGLSIQSNHLLFTLSKYITF